MPNQFELELSQLADSYIQTKQKAISKYIIGFELVDFDEKKSKGIGYFITNINGRYFYVPVFFMNGTMKDFVLLYNKELNQFFPLTDDWIREFASTGQQSLGEKVRTVPNKKTLDFKSLADPFLYKPASLGNLLDFIKKANDKTKMNFLSIVKSNKNLLDFCLDKYGQKFNDTIHSFMNKRANIVQKNIDDQDFEIITSMDKIADKNVYRKVIFMKDGFSIFDKRDKRKLNKKYELNIKEAFCNVTSPGIYQVTTLDGIQEMLISPSPYFLNINMNATLPLALNIKNGTLASIEKERMTVLYNKINKESIDEYLESSKVIKIEDMELNKKYCLVSNTNKNISFPFRIHSKTRSNNKIFFSASNEGGYLLRPKNDFDSANRMVNYDYQELDSKYNIFLVDRDGKISKNISNVYVPKNSYVVEVKDSKINQDYIISNDILTDRMYDFMDEYQTKEASIINKNGKFIYYGKNFVDTALYLAKEANIDVYDAIDSLNSSKLFLVQKQDKLSKEAQQLPMPNSFDFSPSYTTEYKDIDKRVVGSDVRDNFSNLNKDVNNLIQLSKLEDLKIFDDGMIGILHSLQSPELILQREIPPLVQALNRLGKILFIIWYHAYSVKEEFEIDEYSEFEELVQDTFINLGKIVLKLKKKNFNLI